MNNKSKRIFALIIDLIIIGFIYNITINVLNLNVDLGHIKILNLDIIYGYSFIFIIYLVYFFVFDFVNKGITFGKNLTKIKVISNTEENLNYNIFLRSSLKVLSLMIFPIAGFLFILNGYTIQDIVVRTETINYQ